MKILRLILAVFAILQVISDRKAPAYAVRAMADAVNKDLCRAFEPQRDLAEDLDEAPPPVRTREISEPAIVSVSEELFYRDLGLVPSQDGGYICLTRDANNQRREFTVFKVKPVDNLLVVTAFLPDGEFLPQQQTAATDLFLATIRFYTDIPQPYYQGIQSYFQEFYARVKNGRLKPHSDRVYLLDEPTKTVVLYHPLNGELQGTAISLNIRLQ